MSQSVFQKRRAKLAAFLSSIPDKGFNMCRWVSQGNRYVTPSRYMAALKAAKRNKFECGMAACVGGYAVLVFPRLLTHSGEDGYPILREETWISGSEAIAKVLGITGTAASALCAGDAAHRTPKAAAKFLRSLKDAPKPTV